jgi:hypothetical protein
MGPIGFSVKAVEILDKRIPFWRGFCGHPLEQTWGTGVKKWTCYKCLSVFVLDEVEQVWKHEDGRPAVWKSLGIT